MDKPEEEDIKAVIIQKTSLATCICSSEHSHKKPYFFASAVFSGLGVELLLPLLLLLLLLLVVVVVVLVVVVLA